MDMINLAHGSLYMVGAFLAAGWSQATGSFVLGVLLRDRRSPRCSAWLLEVTLLRTLYARDHLSQVLATFALILILNDGVQHDLRHRPAAVDAGRAFRPGRAAAGPAVPGLPPADHRASALAVALLLWLLVAKTRIGMLVRAGASNREMAHGDGRRHRRACSRSSSASARRCARWPARCSGRCSRCRSAWARTS